MIPSIQQRNRPPYPNLCNPNHHHGPTKYLFTNACTSISPFLYFPLDHQPTSSSGSTTYQRCIAGEVSSAAEEDAPLISNVHMHMPYRDRDKHMCCQSATHNITEEDNDWELVVG